MPVVRAENLRNVSAEIFCVKQFWGKNYKKCQYWAITFFSYRKEMRVFKAFQNIRKTSNFCCKLAKCNPSFPKGSKIIVFSKSETHKHGSVLSFVYILFYIEKSGTFQWKSVHFWCKQEIILSRVCEFQLEKENWFKNDNQKVVRVEEQITCW